MNEDFSSPLESGLVIGIPLCGRPVMPEWALSLATMNFPLNLRVTYHPVKGKEVGEARNEIVEAALQQKAKYLWFLDDDVAPPYYAIRRLVYILEQRPKAMVAGGIYTAKAMPPDPLVYLGDGAGAFWHWKFNDIFPVTGLGTGCMLIRMELFQSLSKPWFRTVDEDLIDHPENTMARKLTRQQISDDLYFCKKVIAAGHEILADGGTICLHWDVTTGRHYTLPADSYPFLHEAEATIGTTEQ